LVPEDLGQNPQPFAQGKSHGLVIGAVGAQGEALPKTAMEVGLGVVERPNALYILTGDIGGGTGGDKVHQGVLVARGVAVVYQQALFSF
jgi:hypothetical protein